MTEKMKRSEAIRYLTKKNKLLATNTDKSVNEKNQKENEKQIKEVMTHGEIYGDPVVILTQR